MSLAKLPGLCQPVSVLSLCEIATSHRHHGPAGAGLSACCFVDPYTGVYFRQLVVKDMHVELVRGWQG